MAQTSNVLLILAITALMAIVTAMLTYFVDLIPVAFGKETLVASSAVEGNAQLALDK